jgi:hypothetical protein
MDEDCQDFPALVVWTLQIAQEVGLLDALDHALDHTPEGQLLPIPELLQTCERYLGIAKLRFPVPVKSVSRSVWEDWRTSVMGEAVAVARLDLGVTAV